MRTITCLLAVLASTNLAGCKAIQNSATFSGFTSPSPAGVISGELAGNPTGTEIDSQGDGFAYAAGSIEGEGLKAVAGLVQGTNVSFRPSTGTATYSGRYELVRVTGIALNGDSIYGFTSTDQGNITLTADFAAKSIAGSSGDLSVSGQLTGTGLEGDASYRGVSGTLSGLVGGDKAVAAFHGNSAELIYAGGILAPRD